MSHAPKVSEKLKGVGRGLKGRLAVQGTVGANGSHAARVLDQGNRKAVDQPVSELHLFRGAGGVGLDGEGVERGPSGGAEDPVAVMVTGSTDWWTFA